MRNTLCVLIAVLH